MADQTRRELTIVLTGDAKGLTGTVQISRQQLQDLGATLDQTGNKAKQAGAATATAFDKVGTRMAAVGSMASRAKTLMLGFVSATAAVQVGRGLLDMADAYTNIGARLRLASAGTVTFAAAQAQVLAVAKSTSTGLATVADLVSNLATSFRSLGGNAKLSFQSAVGLSKEITQAVALSGASAEAANAALIQLGQGLASGTLRGDELNSVMEQTPRLAKAIADGMGTTIGQLRKLGAQGLITAKDIVKALSNQRQQLEDEFRTLPLTVGRAWEKLKTSVLSYVGVANQASGASSKIAAAISSVADHIDDIGRAIVALGQLVATVYATKMIAAGVAWIGNLTEQSAAVAANGAAVEGWSATTSASFANARKNIGLLGIALNVVGAAVIGWQIGKYINAQFLDARLAAVAFVDGTMVLWEKLKEGAAIAWASIKAVAVGALNSIRESLASLAAGEASLFQKLPGGSGLAAQLTDLAAKLRPATSAADDLQLAIAKISAETDKNIAAIHRTTNDMADYEIAQQRAKDATAAAVKPQDDLAASLKKLLAQLQVTGAGLGAHSKEVTKLASAYQQLADWSDKLEGKSGSPIDNVNAQYLATIRDGASKAAAVIAAADNLVAKGHMSVAAAAQIEADAQKRVSDGIDAANAVREQEIAKVSRQMDVSGRLIDQIEQEAHVATLNARDQAAARAGMQYEQEARQANLKLTQQQMDAEKQRVEAAAADAFDMKQIADQQREVAQEYAGYWENAASSISKAFGDLVTGQITKFKDFGKSLKDIAQQFVSDIVAQFLRLKVLGPILSGAMGTVGGWLGIAGDLSGSSLSINNGYYGGGGIIGTTAGSVGDTGGAGGYAGYIQQGLQGYKAYNWATGLFGGSAAASPAYAGSASIINAAGNIGGNYGAMAGGMYAPGYAPVGGAAFNVGAPAYTPWGGSFSIGGYSAPYASAAGGLLGAYYGMHQGGGGISTGISTIGYGALGAGIAGTAAGVAGGASLGTAAGSAFGAAAASTSWIPIVGWIMAGLAALDHFSGGKVFGSGWKPAQSNVALNVGPDGSSASANETLWKYKGQTGLSLGGFLTGGLSQLSWWGDKKTKTEQLDVTPEMLQAAQQLYDSMEKVLVSGAQKLGTTVPDMIEASITAQTTYNKKGKVQGTEYLVQYLGQTWKEATAEAASERLGADALLSVVAASAGDVANKIAKQWQDSADTLADGVQTLLEAQQDIVRGNSLVALGSSATLQEVIAFTQGLQASGEKLADTYTRLMQASKAYEQFVGQFTPTSTDFGAALEAIAKQMQANIDQANQLALAAGMQGAAETDLAHIHEQAAEQAATAIAQLNSAAQDLAAKLYSVTTNTLSAVSAQLDKLQGKTQSALQLALGDNSPYNDKQKLDLALQGLRSGLTSADDVLSLGRKLYASSADYTGLFNKVQDILGLPGASGQQSLQDALKQYNGLYGQQQALQGQADATARFGDAKTLAQYVAEISTTHGIDYNEAASGLGFNLSDLAKDLGVTNIAGYLDQLKLQDIPGTTMDASASIVDAIQKLGRDLIQTITGAPLTSATGVTGSTSTATAEQTALLKSIDARLAAIEQSSDTTANTNKTMVNQGASKKLNDLATSPRGAARVMA